MHYIEVHLRRRANKKGEIWYAEWYSPTPAGRKHETEVIGLTAELTARKAKRARDAIKERVNREARISRTWTVARFVAEVWFPPRKRSWALNSRTAIEGVVKNHIIPAFGEMLIADIRKHHVEAWLMKMSDAGYGHGTGKMALAMMRSICTEAEENDVIQRSPARRVKLPTMASRAETQPYSIDECARIVATPGVDGIMLRVLLFCGLRPGELAALRGDDVMDGGRRLRIDESIDRGRAYKSPKTQKSNREVSVPPRLAVELAAMACGAHEPLFAEDGLPWRPQSLRRHLQRVVGLPGFDLRRCRATFASHFAGDITDAAGQLGHSKIDTTSTHYRRPVPERLAAAVEELEARVMGRVQ